MSNKVKKFNLKYNNIPVIYQYHEHKSTSIIIDFNIGSMWETEKEKGIAHLVEHLIFKDTGKHDSTELLKLLEVNGADINACTSFDFTRFYFTSNNDSFKETLHLFIEMLMFKNISEHEFKSEKSTVLQELKMSLDNPNTQIYYNWMKDIFNIDDIIGFEKTLKNITLKDVYRWISKYFIANNMTISIVSGFSKNKIKKLLEQELCNFRSIDTNSYDYEKIEYLKSKVLKTITHKYNQFNYKKKRQYQQNHIIVNYPLPIKCEDDIIKAEAVKKVLSNGLTSILFREIREKYGYCYTIKAYVDVLMDKDFRNIVGHNLIISTNCMPQYVNDCIKQIKKVMNNLNDIIIEEDLIKIKNKHKNTYRNFIEKTEINLENYKIFGKIKNDMDKTFYNLTLNDIKEYINTIDTKSNININVYGPQYE